VTNPSDFQVVSIKVFPYRDCQAIIIHIPDRFSNIVACVQCFCEVPDMLSIIGSRN